MKNPEELSQESKDFKGIINDIDALLEQQDANFARSSRKDETQPDNTLGVSSPQTPEISESRLQQIEQWLNFLNQSFTRIDNYLSNTGPEIDRLLREKNIFLEAFAGLSQRVSAFETEFALFLKKLNEEKKSNEYHEEGSGMFDKDSYRAGSSKTTEHEDEIKKLIQEKKRMESQILELATKIDNLGKEMADLKAQINSQNPRFQENQSFENQADEGVARGFSVEGIGKAFAEMLSLKPSSSPQPSSTNINKVPLDHASIVTL